MIATGIFNAHQMLIRPDFLFSTSYGVLLVIKIIFVIGLLVAFGVHVRIIRKEIEQKIMAKQLSDSQITKLRTKIIIVGQVTVGLSVAVLFMASLLDAGI
jgi:putative copper export protein